MTRSAKNALSSMVVPTHVIMLVLHVGDIIGEREVQTYPSVGPFWRKTPRITPPSPICNQPKYVDRRLLLQEAAASPTALSASIHSFIPPLPLDMIWSSLTWTALAAFCEGVSSRKITPYTDGYINYTTVPGYFLQDDPTTNASTFNYVCPHHTRLPTRSRRRRITSDLQDLDQFWPDQSNL